MGLLKAGIGAASGVLADSWREYFYCDSLEADVLAAKGKKRTSKRSSNTKGEDNIISNGSIIAVNEGQCMLIVEQGKVVDICCEPGEFVYDKSSEPSIFYGDLGESIKDTFKTIGKRFTAGGDTAKDQRIYFINTKEILGNKYGTANPVPFRVVDRNIGLDIDISIRCNGEYSYKIVDPMLFYTNVCGNVTEEFTRDKIDSQLKTELMTALQPAFAKISEMGIRYSAIPGHTLELSEALNEALSKKWIELRGIAVYSFGVNTVKASEEDEDLIKDLQKSAVLRNPNMAGAVLAGAQADAMKSAAKNENGAFMGFAGMNMANNAGGMNPRDLFAMNGGNNRNNYDTQNYGQNNNMRDNTADNYRQENCTVNQGNSSTGTWTCSCGSINTGRFCMNCGKEKPINEGRWICKCGTSNTGKFCMNCGAKKPELSEEWTCSCGSINKGRFCQNCGSPKPKGAKVYKCDKCGWEPQDKNNPPKFCPQCGDIFDDNDEQ